MALKVGDTVGDYEIAGVLGKGGMGTVFRVRNLISNRMEAMKVALSDLSADPGLGDRFLREIRLHASLEHPNIAALRTALRINNQILMIMELVEGESLDLRLQKGPIDVTTSIHYVDQVLSALELAHSRGIIHRDIKPANIIVTPDDIIKLTDFGIARSAEDRNLTQTGLALGSLYYMSPEQVQALPADQRSDVYSLGVTFYEMVTGKRPIEGSSEYAILNAHLSHMPESPGRLNPQVPIMLSAAIMRALAKQPSERFQSASDFRQALKLIHGFTTMTAMDSETVVTKAAPDPARAHIEAALMKSVGPIARILMARIASQCSSADELRGRLAEQITSDAERSTFLREVAMPHPGVAASAAPRPKPKAEITQWDPALLAKAKQQLAVYAGPIASLIVDRAARTATSPQQLYQMLAKEIESDRDRAAFLKLTPIVS